MSKKKDGETERWYGDGDGDGDGCCVICLMESRDTLLLPCRHMVTKRNPNPSHILRQITHPSGLTDRDRDRDV